MYRKKEWVLIAVCLILFLGIGLYFKFQKKETKIVEEDRVAQREKIIISVKGELVRPVELEYFGPTTYGAVFLQIRYLLNEYSDLSGFDMQGILAETKQIIIPSLDQKNDFEQDAFIHINDASLPELIQLYGIGEKRGERILAYRKTSGKITSWEEFWRVVNIHNEETQRRIMEQAIL